ncbi:MAG: protein kinase [Proteobacteria bacterium]|nr:protein kinase [Pseudomonadota bacterium]
MDQGRIVTETVAIKTLKGMTAARTRLSKSLFNMHFPLGFYDGSTVRDMLKECSKMSKFDHPNILTLRGVCLDGGPAPYIIMPFMANGNLLTYLKDNRKTLIIASGCEENEVSLIIIVWLF